VDAGPVLAHATPGSEIAPLTPVRLLTGWSVEPLPLLVTLLAAGCYLVGVWRLRSRGAAWPAWRSVSFLGLGLGSFLVATQSALAAYDTVLLSVHMVQHMVLSMITPIFLALGAPITLALRTLPPRQRRWLLRLLHSRVARVLTFPPLAGAAFVATPFVLYLGGFGGLYEATLRNGLLHDLNHLHFVFVGCLWFWPLLGVDPMPRRIAYPLRLIAVFATLPFHAFLGVAVMSTSTLIAGDWYAEIRRGWGASIASDQRTAGGILWAAGDLVGLLVLGVLAVQWMRASEREAQRVDRRLDREEARLAAQAGRPAGTIAGAARRVEPQPAEEPHDERRRRDDRPGLQRRRQHP
jgi:cytochrome c oxidase assembly factor CtaG